MLVSDKGDELCDFSNIQPTSLESQGVDLGSISPCVLQNFNLDMDCDPSTGEDFLHELSNDLEIPMLLEEGQHFKENDNFMESSALLDNLEDMWPNGIFGQNMNNPIMKKEMNYVKSEPRSPAGSSPSPLSNDSWHSNGKKVVMDTPPISPPDPASPDNSPPRSPGVPVLLTSKTITCDDSLRGRGPAMLISPHENVTMHHLHPRPQQPQMYHGSGTGDDTKPVFICDAPTRRTIRILPYNSDLNGKKRLLVSANEISVVPLSTPCSLMKVQRQNNKNIGINNNGTRNNIVNSNNVKNLNNIANQTAVTVSAISGVMATTVAANNCENSSSDNKSNSDNLNSGSSSNNSAVIPPSAIKIEPVIPPSVRQEIQMRVLKRQQRMIKNRESACLSRKKKKEYVSSLEARVTDLENENAQLKMENAALKDRLNDLESSVISSSKSTTFQSPQFRKTSILLGIILILSVNLGSISLLSRTPPELMSRVDSIRSSRHHSRSLLWTQLDLEDPSTSPDVLNSTSGFPHNPLTCPLYINQTESLRLNSELRRWIGVDEEAYSSSNMNTVYFNNTSSNSNSINKHNNANNIASSGSGHLKKKTMRREEKKSKQLMLPTISTSLPTRPSASDTDRSPSPRFKRKLRMHRKLFHEVDLLGTQVEQAGFLHAIRRRDDTFYVVSFSGDHLLLPAIAHNNTLRPKMSLVLPSLPVNGSLNMGEPFTMMQIDCEVLDTRLVELKETDIPPHLRTTTTASTSDPDGHQHQRDDFKQADSGGPQRQKQHQHVVTNDVEAMNMNKRPYRPYFVRSQNSNSSSHPGGNTDSIGDGSGNNNRRDNIGVGDFSSSDNSENVLNETLDVNHDYSNLYDTSNVQNGRFP